MKKITKILIATLMAVSTTSTGLMAQNRTYTGPYPLNIVGHSYESEGTATYSYIDDYDLGRIYNGPFSLKWDNNYRDSKGYLSGQYLNDKQDGVWKYQENTHNSIEILTLTFKDGVLDGPSTFSTNYSDYTSYEDIRWVLQMNFKNGKIDGPFSINFTDLNGQTDAFLKGKVVQNYPAIGWEYKPYDVNAIETSFRYLGDDPDSPDKIEIREFDTRTGDVKKDVEEINRDRPSYNTFYDSYDMEIIHRCVNHEFENVLERALELIDRLILRKSTKRNSSTRLSNQE